MSKKLYIAYGSNLNLKQMKYRCPTAKLVGKGVVENYELQFKGMPPMQQSHLASVSPLPLHCGNFSREMKNCLTATRVIPPTTSSKTCLFG